ncbi:hypothetical protein L9F63_027879, partial [Diploptera punctata]
GALTSSNPILRCAAGESLGRMGTSSGRLTLHSRVGTEPASTDLITTETLHLGQDIH